MYPSCPTLSLPDALPSYIAVGLALGKRRRGEQRGRERLQRERNAEFLHHVGLARIVEVGLDRAGSQHHVEAETADARHVIEQDRKSTRLNSSHSCATRTPSSA